MPISTRHRQLAIASFVGLATALALFGRSTDRGDEPTTPARVGHARRTPRTTPRARPAPHGDVVYSERGATVAVAPGGSGPDVLVGLTHVGRGGARTELPAGVRATSHDGARYQRGTLEEWFTETAQGLEHGMTLFERSPGEGVLDLVVGFDGLTPSLVGSDVVLRDEANAPKLVYRDLAVTDTTGRRLPAAMAVVRGSVVLRVDDTEAEYPVTVDPILTSQTAILSASDGAANDEFGGTPFEYSGGPNVAIDGTLAVVSGTFDDSPQGSVYVFSFSGSTWSQVQKIVPPVAIGNSASFGYSIALSGNTLVVGAPSGFGRAAVYDWGGSAFTLNTVLSDTTGEDFGCAVAVSGDAIAIGARYDDRGTGGGAVSVFRKSGAVWSLQQRIKAGDQALGDDFGTQVAIEGATNTLVVSAIFHPAATPTGAAYVFTRPAATWTLEQKLLASDSASLDQFSRSLALRGNQLVVGAPQNQVTLFNQGAAYVFARTGSTWTESTRLLASDAAADDQFGFAVALDAGVALIGSRFDDAPGAVDAGSTYAYRNVGTTWIDEVRTIASVPAADDRYGDSVALSGTTAIVGAPHRDAAASNSGSAYILSVQPKKSNGQGCSASTECSSNFCVDSVCCNTACAGGSSDCQACSVAAGGPADGTCGARAPASSCDDGSTCTTGDTCAAGSCGGATPCFSGTSCSGGGGPGYTCSACPAGFWSTSGTGSTACMPVTTCSAGQYQSAPPTASSNTVCTSCGNGGSTYSCGPGFFRSGVACVGTGLTDSQTCTALTVCSLAQYESAAPTANSDRVCTALTVCSGAQYQSTAATATSDRVCTALTVCSPAQYESLAPTATTDRACTALTVCSATEYQSTAATATSDRVCSALTDCAAGSFVSAPETATSDRVCAACGPGSFSTGTNAPACTAWSGCVAGEFVSVVPSSVADRVCAPCGPSEFSATANASACTAWASCAPNEYETTAPSASNDRGCAAVRDCVAGEFVTSAPTATSDRVCSACAGGTFTAALNAAACAPWTPCAPGEFVATPGSTTDDQVCNACAPGTYSVGIDASACASWTACVAGEFVSTAGSATADQACSSCGSGEYSTTTNAATCTAWTTCPAGSFVSTAGGLTSDQTCTACGSTEYSSTANASACTPYTDCTPSEFESVPPTPTSDRVCAPVGPCGMTEYEVSPPTGMMNRVCAPYTVCTGTEYQSTAPTGTSDRVCSPLTACAGTEYESTAPTTVSDRVCTALTVCTASEYESTLATATSDRACTALTTCTASEYESTLATATSDRVCTALTTCTASEYESTAATATADRACTACTVCGPGTVETTACTATADTVCTASMVDAGATDAGASDAGGDADVATDASTVDAGDMPFPIAEGGCGCTLAGSATNTSVLTWSALFGLATVMIARRRRR